MPDTATKTRRERRLKGGTAEAIRRDLIALRAEETELTPKAERLAVVRQEIAHLERVQDCLAGAQPALAMDAEPAGALR